MPGHFLNHSNEEDEDPKEKRTEDARESWHL